MTQSAAMGMPMEIDHLLPIALNGTSDEENLWLACPQCNRAKGVQTRAIDPDTGRSAPLYNPRTQLWAAHFAWQENGLYIIGISSIGRATVAALRMNNEWVLRARLVWIRAGIHPPVE
ncbi:MAG TPA: HNH endonuclease signature motif containing protein [Caldilineaceae bacterium]|nr:HNH endonuclease signature motif containing protein [Caldilineaceae bacterium]